MFQEKRSHAVYLLEKQGISRLDVLNFISHGISKLNTDDTAANDGELSPSGGAAEPSRTATDPLEAYTVNLIEKAQNKKIDPLIGREAEIQRTIQVLCRRRKNNPIYVGDPVGVGKNGHCRRIGSRDLLTAKFHRRLRVWKFTCSIWVP